MSTFVFDSEIIGQHKPTWLVCIKDVDNGNKQSFWGSRKRDRQLFANLFLDPEQTWVSFNGIKFDEPLITMWLFGYDPKMLKLMANRIINERMQPWDALRAAGISKLPDVNHIDLVEVAPGVMTSLKTYAGRMFMPSLIDLPFEHDQDLKPREKKLLEEYCFNDLDCTAELYKRLSQELKLREELSEQHGMDLRSKSDAQVAEAILKKAVGVVKANNIVPTYVRYRAPDIIKTDDPHLRDLIKQLEAWFFEMKDGSPQLPMWLLNNPIRIGSGVYQVGIGGLHSKHDVKVHYKNRLISDFDVASYYPSIMLNCGITPKLSGGRGEVFIEAYREIYEKRLAAKKAGDKRTANALKISLNGTFGKLGSKYSALYTPDLMIAVTITGQLNLLCLISELTEAGIEVLSANTDGIMLGYTEKQRAKMLKIIAANAKHTGFEYEETPYSQVAMKDVNNYIAITIDGKIKAKGLYADPGLMKNPTMPVCSKAAQLYLRDGTAPEKTIRAAENFVDFTAVRNVKGGGEQGGLKLGRVVRWYMTTEKIGAIRYSSNGNLVPKTEGARACMVLPENFPADLNYQWYVDETYEMLRNMGVTT